MSKSIQLNNRTSSKKGIVFSNTTQVISLRIDKAWLKKTFNNLIMLLAGFFYTIILFMSYNLNQLFFEELLIAGGIIIFAVTIKIINREH